MRLLPGTLLATLALTLACADPAGDADAKDDDSAAPDTPAVDADGDGYDDTEDCNDAVASIHPGAAEVCDPGDVDENCNDLADNGDATLSDGTPAWRDGDGDGYGADEVSVCDLPAGYVLLDGDCDDADPALNPDTLWFADTDADGFGDPAVTTPSCEVPAGYTPDDTDCDDARPDVHPGADERCDDVDQDCDGYADEEPIDESTWYRDADGDGAGDAAVALVQCDAPAGYLSDASDCDDASAAIHSGASEVCDAADTDEDCDGVADDADASVDTATGTLWYLDSDGDGHGGGSVTLACSLPAGATAESTDCNDADAAVHPDAPELCDATNTDQDCDGLADDADPDVDTTGMSTWHPDADADGYGSPDTSAITCDAPTGWLADATDCDDASALAYPGATEIWYDGIDGDCAGDDDDDQDADGLNRWHDCDDTDPTPITPAAEHTSDGVDNDCDGFVDEATIADVADARITGVSGSYLAEEGGLAIGGDLTGDGVDDLVATSRDYVWVISGPTVATTSGEADVLYTSRLSIGAAYDLEVNVQGPLRDLTGDDRADLLVAMSDSYGMAQLYDATSTVVTASFLANASSTAFEWAVAGDIDGDGVDDVITGAEGDYTTTAAAWCGSVAVFAGGAFSGTHYILLADDVIYGEAGGDYLATSMAVGDLDGDGYEDILAGAPGNDEAGTSAGSVYLFAGNSTLTWAPGADAAARAQVTGSAAGDALGMNALATPGDLDGDGSLDLALAAQEARTAWIFFDGATVTGTTAASSADASITDSQRYFASALTYASDLDGDGADELVLGSNWHDGGYYASSGAAFVFDLAGVGGAFTTADATNVFYGAGYRFGLGASFASGGDLDGDGLEDLVVGSPEYGSLGAAYVILGR